MKDSEKKTRKQYYLKMVISVKLRRKLVMQTIQVTKSMVSTRIPDRCSSQLSCNVIEDKVARHFFNNTFNRATLEQPLFPFSTIN